MALQTQIGGDLSYRDQHGNELAYAAFNPELKLYLFQIANTPQEVTGLCFPPMSATACRLAADLIEQMMLDAGY